MVFYPRMRRFGQEICARWLWGNRIRPSFVRPAALKPTTPLRPSLVQVTARLSRDCDDVFGWPSGTVFAPPAWGFSQNEQMAETNTGCVGSLTRGIGPVRAITIIFTPAIADLELLHGYDAPEPAVRVRNTSDISAILTFGSVPNSGDDMTDKGDDDTADVTIYVSYLVEAETESQQEDLFLPAPPLLLDR